jgi:hypothetical protein
MVRGRLNSLLALNPFQDGSALGGRRCRVRGLNSRPTVYKTAALPLS